MTKEEYVQAIRELLNRDPDPKQRAQRLREANRELFVAAVRADDTTPDHAADLALARAGL